MINRDKYISKVSAFIDKPIIKVLVGQRRVGKSYVLKLIIDDIKKRNPTANIIFVDKEKYEFDNISDHKDLVSFVEKHKKDRNNYLLIDEVQEINDFEKALRSILNEGGTDIYCTGSNAHILSGELATMLSGRYIQIEVHSLSFNEFLFFHKLKKNQKALDKYLKFGGLPFLIHLHDEDEVIKDYLRNIYQTIIFKDVVSRYNIRDVSFLQNLIQFLASNTGTTFSATNITKYLKSQNITKSTSVIIDYLSYLCDAFFIHKVKRMDIQGKKIFEIGEKYYFEDIGIRNALEGYRPDNINQIMENAIFHHLRYLGYTVYIGKLGEFEVDFIAEKNNERIYIQSCYLLANAETIDREFGHLLKIKDQYPKFVVSMDMGSFTNTYKGIKHLTLLDFLMTEEDTLRVELLQV